MVPSFCSSVLLVLGSASSRELQKVLPPADQTISLVELYQRMDVTKPASVISVFAPASPARWVCLISLSDKSDQYNLHRGSSMAKE